MRSPVPILIALLALGATGCTMVGRTPAPAPMPASVATPEPQAAPELVRYQGVAQIAGDRFGVELELTRRGRSDVEALLWIEALGLRAAGQGTSTAGRLELSMTYGGTCEGTLTVSARLTDDGRRGEGRLEAADCTGTAAGPLEVELRSATPIMAPGHAR